MAHADIIKIVITVTTLRLRDCLKQCNALKSRVCPLITPVAETIEHARMQGCMLTQGLHVVTSWDTPDANACSSH